MSETEIDLRELINQSLLAYGNNEETIKNEITQLSKYSSFKYRVNDTYTETGGKIPNALAQNSLFIDCHYMNKDMYQFVYSVSLQIKRRNYPLFLSLRTRLNKLLVFIRDEVNMCEYAMTLEAVLSD